MIEHTFDKRVLGDVVLGDAVLGGVVRELESAEAAIRALQDLDLAGQHPQTVLDVTQRLFTLADRLDAALQRAVEQIHWSNASWDAAHLGPRRWLM